VPPPFENYYACREESDFVSDFVRRNSARLRYNQNVAERPGIGEIEEQAALFALGTLPAPEAEHFRQRLESGCPVCRGLLRESEETLALVALAAPPAAPPARLRERLLETVRAGERGEAPAADEGLIVRPGDTPWEAQPLPGVEVRRLLEQKTMLVRMAPGAQLPAHRHRQAEQCLVLEGSVTADGVTAFAGDFTYMPAGSLHQPLRSETGCLLLIAYS